MDNSNRKTTRKKKLQRTALNRLHRADKWQEETGQYRPEDQRALRALRYQEEPPEKTLRELEQQLGLDNSGTRSRLQRLPVRLALAASFLLMIVAGYFTYNHMQQEERLFAQHFEYIPSSIKVEGAERGEDLQSSSLLAAGVQAYESGQYKDAEGLFRAYLARNSDAAEVRFYYAVLQLGKGNAAVALPLLEATADQPPREGYKRAAEWYLGLAKLKLDQREDAITYFKSLEDGEDRFAKNARAVLATLR